MNVLPRTWFRRLGPVMAVLVIFCLLTGAGDLSGIAFAKPKHPAPSPLESAKGLPLTTVHQPEHVILFVLEGMGEASLKTGAMPVLSRLVKQGAVTWAASSLNPPLRLPTMASLLTGMSAEKHGITWNDFDFARGYPRPPTVFDYLDLSGGRDSAIFFMDESLYQLAKPEPYTDYQICGALRPECNTATVVSYIKQYFKKATSGHGYGHAILSLPHFLVVHLPEPGRAAQASGWTSPAYREALRSVDKAMDAVLELYKELGLLSKSTILITSLSGYGATATDDTGGQQSGAAKVPWIASGVGVKTGYVIAQPVSILDTGATVLRTLGLETYTEWESRPVEEIFVAARPTNPGGNGK